MSGRSEDERELIESLRHGDERAFRTLVDRHGAAMLRHAHMFIRDQGVAEEVVQEAWLGVLRGIERFQARSSLRTWLFTIVANVARTRGAREARFIPFSALTDEGASVPPERFLGAGDRWAGHWATPPEDWGQPERELLSTEIRAVVADAIADLPESQRQVISLRDVEGWTADEACNVLELTETNQRVLLHRARSKVRRALDEYLNREK